jgi:hypothetical protein
LGTDVKKEREAKRKNSYECVIRLGTHLPFAIFFSPLFMAKLAAFILLSIRGFLIEFAR